MCRARRFIAKSGSLRAIFPVLLLLVPAVVGAANLTSAAVQPTTVVNGVTSVFTVTLSAAAPRGGALVALTSHNPDVAYFFSSSLTIPQGATSSFARVQTNVVASSTQVVIDASYGGVTRSATLTVTPREPVRGVEDDLWADVILGKPDFTEFTPNEVVPYKVFNPGGVFVDRSVSPGRAYVWDSGNSRLLGIDLATCYAGQSPCSPQIVIGQPSGSDHSSCNGDSGFQRYPTRAPASASSLCGIPEVTISILENKSYATMAGDSQGNLYVPDAYNNRVLKYLSPFTTDPVADEVWGQADFSGNLCNRGASPSASTLCFTTGAFSAGGVALDSGGNLWVADHGNNRVLRFPKNPSTGEIAKTADLVLGQRDFASNGADSGLASMWSPSALRFGPSGQLYVTDSNNNRVLVFTPNPNFASGMPASLFGSQFRGPYGMEADPAGEGLWINDTSNSMLELWSWDGSAVLKVLGKDTYQPNGSCGLICYSGGGIGIDGAGNVLPSMYVNTQDVFRFSAPIPAPNPGVVYQPDRRFFSPPEGYNTRGLKGLRSGQGVATYGDQLVVADAGRLVFWNGLSTLTSGKPADGLVGIAEFQYQYDCCSYLKMDGSGRLWSLRYNNSIDVYQMPLTSGQAPLQTILPSGSVPVLGGGSLTFGDPGGVGLVPTADGAFLWITDRNNHRVLRVRNPLSNPQVDVVLGQTNLAGHDCNRGLVPPPNQGPGPVATADMLCYPGALSLDRQGNLFVSDHSPEADGNWRLLMFAASLFPSNNSAPLFAVPASKIFPYWGGQPAITFEPAFDSFNRMVVGYNSIVDGSFVGVYNDPLGPQTDPDTYLNDFSSYPVAMAFDANDNLYIGDGNRSRVLIYRKPLPPLQSLTITKTGSGSGTVTSNPAGINCGAVCSKGFAAGTEVSLATAPAAGSLFAGWSGDADCSDGVVTMDGSKTCTARFEPAPDLIVSTLTVPAGAVAGSTISVTDTTKNQSGTGQAAASTTRFYLSGNSTWDTGDTLIGSRGVPPLEPGVSSSGPASLTIPGGTATGNHYIIARADADGVLTESNETNNTKAVSIRVSPPDLIVSAISVPTTGGAGTTISASSTTKNQTNTGPAPASTTRFYLSSDPSWDAGDPLIGSQAVGGLAPGASEAHSTTLTIASNTAPGTYYVIARADADNLVDETIETNNTKSDTIVIGPDLIVSAFSAPSTAAAGMPFTVTDTTKNQGGGSADTSTTTFYLSTDSTFGGDTLLGSRVVGPLAAGAKSSGPTALTIPAGTAPGTYYILAVSDAPNAVAETVETNNTKADSIKLSPDLIVSALAAPASGAAGAAVSVTDTTKNQGQAAAAATTTSFYLSSDATYETGDVLLASRQIPVLASGATSSASTSITIPSGTASGTWYILARADSANTVAETNETNNVMSKVITVTP